MRPELQTVSQWLADFDKAKNQEITMPIIATQPEGGDFEKVPQGSHIAVCDMVVNLGMQKTDWQGKVSFKQKVYIRFQIPEERVEINGENKPMVIGATYTLSLADKANLRHHLEGWRGRAFTPEELAGFDIAAVLGKACQIAVTHKSTDTRTYANITGIMALPKGMPAPKVEGEAVLYVDQNETPEAFEKLPKWMKEKIAEVSDEPPVQKAAGQDFHDDIPF